MLIGQVMVPARFGPAVSGAYTTYFSRCFCDLSRCLPLLHHGNARGEKAAPV